jgi:hypothetical protein
MNTGALVIKPSDYIWQMIEEAEDSFANNEEDRNCNTFFGCFDDGSILMYVARAYPHVFQTLPLAYNLPGVTGNVGRYGLGSGSLCVVEGCASLLQIDMLKVISPWQHYDEYKFDALVLHFDMNPKPYMVSGPFRSFRALADDLIDATEKIDPADYPGWALRLWFHALGTVRSEVAAGMWE